MTTENAPVTPKILREETIIDVDHVSFWYGDRPALNDVTMAIDRQVITAFIGPSGCGKTTLLRLVNRMSDLVPQARMTGTIRMNGVDIYGPDTDVTRLRRRVGMVFQQPNPFPKSIYENVAYGPRIHGVKSGDFLDEIVERCLRRAFLWEEVEEQLEESALGLSLGQQQRLCIARAIAVEPEVLLMDEPCSSLDPVATSRIEELMLDLKDDYTIVIVTHNMQQAARVSEYTGFMLKGELVEMGVTDAMFTTPRDRRTEDYITGRAG
ncbi:MAG: phosphate ABC transporter ATP-binding protein [Gemmatimonadetes bacterium]|nr:phosphate ABC transporter ATP-binding protein PstB [Gemmatimonadota bacterium]MXY49198.1 phosphate ABC transporter ATP-binding protein [Gemmatimonadota bacterium]MYG85717.1 phosphate ABC transporter ATP-binding protein [Gemmatimonadota bacterium]MYJ90127.1 phosphate ABC transporter ATP-binding protein [Gemmatimonadota bacterium]